MEKLKVQNYPMVSPTPIVLVGATVNSKPNYAAVGAYGVVCLKPILYISLKDTHHTTSGVRETGYFSVNIPSAGLVQKVDYCGMVSGANVDKSELFTNFYDPQGDAPMISDCPLNFLCKVIQSTKVFDFEVFFGEIVSTYADPACTTDGAIDPLKINPLLSMGMNYYNLGKFIGKPFQEGRALLNK